jgi:glycosyltransferase involved in cell wall biosynthesis
MELVQNEVDHFNLPNIIFTKEEMDTEKYVKTFKSIDCYVSLSKGEGFSIQPREAMLLGIPVIATDNTGQSPICDSQLVRTVQSTGTEPASNSSYGGFTGRQYTCELDDAVEALKDVKENYDFYLSRGEQAREWALQYDFSNMKPLYRSIVIPTKICLGEVNEITENGITTTSPHLIEKYRKAFGAEIVEEDPLPMPSCVETHSAVQEKHV